MSQSCVMSLVSANLMRSTFCLSKSKPWFIGAAKLGFCTSKPVRVLASLTCSCTKFDFFNQTGPPEIQFPGGSTSEEELPSRPSKGPDLVPLEVPELPHVPEINPSETQPEITTVPSDPPPLGPPQTPGPEFPDPPPMPDTPNPPSPKTPPDETPPNWEPPHSPEIPSPGIDPPPPMGPTII